MVPEGWERVPLGDVVEVRLGATPARSDPDYWATDGDSGFPWVSIGDLDSGRWLSETQEKITSKGIQNSSVKLVEPGTTLISFKLTLGKAARAAVPLYTNEAIAALVPLNEMVDDQFLYYAAPRAVRSSPTAAQAVKGVTLNKTKLQELVLLLPPTPEQEGIAAILRSADDAIAATRKVIEQTKQVKKGLLQDLMTRGIGHTRFKKTEIGEIPEAWEVTLLEDVAQRGSGHTPSKKFPEYWDGDIKWVSLADSQALDQVYLSNTDKTITPEGIANSSAVIHPKGTVFVSRDASVGRSAIAACDLAVSQHFIAWQCGPKLNNHFLYYFLQYHKPQFERFAVGSTIKTIGLRYFKRLRIPLPPWSEQDAIAECLLSHDRSIWRHRSVGAALDRLKAGLMQDLLTGRVRVNVD